MKSTGASTRLGVRRRRPGSGRILPLLLGAALLAAPGSALAKVTGDTIVLGAAVSLTGKYTTAGHHTRNGYDFAVKTINERGDIRAGVIDDATRYGMEVVIDDKLPRDLNDMTATLLKVKAVRPDVLVVSGHSKGAALLVRQAAELKASAPIVAMTHCESAEVTDRERFGDAAEGILCAAQWAPSLTYRDELFGSAADYAERFEQEYGYVPPYQAAESTAAVMVWADALQRAGAFDAETVRDALAATDMQTFYGNIRFDETGRNVAKPMVLRQIQNGVYRVVAPTEWASHELVFPRPH